MVLIKLAVTGSLSSGKSTFCQMLREEGAFVVSADQIVHQLISSDPHVIKQLKALFGDEIVDDGTINRKKVADLAFQSDTHLKKLEAILHPLVRAEIQRLYEEEKNKMKARLFVAEVPLLFETEDPTLFYDATATVTAPQKTRQQRSKLTQHDFLAREKRHFNEDKKKENATFVIDNSGSLKNLKKQAQTLLQTLS